jgi:hypothetical protein
MIAVRSAARRTRAGVEERGAERRWVDVGARAASEGVEVGEPAVVVVTPAGGAARRTGDVVGAPARAPRTVDPGEPCEAGRRVVVVSPAAAFPPPTVVLVSAVVDGAVDGAGVVEVVAVDEPSNRYTFGPEHASATVKKGGGCLAEPQDQPSTSPSVTCAEPAPAPE